MSEKTWENQDSADFMFQIFADNIFFEPPCIQRILFISLNGFKATSCYAIYLDKLLYFSLFALDNFLPAFSFHFI